MFFPWKSQELQIFQTLADRVCIFDFLKSQGFHGSECMELFRQRLRVVRELLEEDRSDPWLFEDLAKHGFIWFFFAKTRINPWFLFSFPIKKKRNGFWVHSHYNFLLVSHGNFLGSPFFGQTLSGLTSFSTTVAHVALQPRNTGKHSTNFRSLSKFNQLFGWLMLRPHHDVSINDGLIEGICPNMCSYQQFFRQLND